MEGSHSGLVRHLGKVVWGKPHQGFKSLTLRRIMSELASEYILRRVATRLRALRKGFEKVEHVARSLLQEGEHDAKPVLSL